MTKRAAARQQVIGGVDTHGRTHHAAAIDAVTGKLLGEREFPATAKGYRALLDWLRSFGKPVKVGVESTGSYGAGLTIVLLEQGIEVLEVSRPNRADRRRIGKSDPIDAIAAARAVMAETATATPKPKTGPVEAIRLLRVTRLSAVKARRAAINQMHGLLFGAPQELRESLTGHTRAALVTRCARLRPGGDPADPTAAAKTALRRLARRVENLDLEIAEADRELRILIAATAPRTLGIFGAGPEVAGQLLTTAGENPDRLASEATLARLCGVAPIPASSGNTTRHRLHRGGDRAANSAVHMLVINRLRWHAPTRAYAERRAAEGKTKKEIIRCLKRAVIREIYRALIADLGQPCPASITPAAA
jgi:transposase